MRWKAMLQVLPPTLQQIKLLQFCVNTDFWLDKIMRHMVPGIYVSWCKTSLPRTGKTRDVDG